MSEWGDDHKPNPDDCVSIWQEFKKRAEQAPELAIGITLALTCIWIVALLWLVSLP